ncbi:extracellular solute-binding protein [Paenibacillus albicereus]|uniref:Extracellular solute-binding protein n=1 Tax=Paenibacillus albicereus TaxID=2726185 RepID=A0A6H2GU98_9BACL|nr:extracellular solute-binding protein [Paenibacillus albicereus]QJC50965.1 extracellular solute-binding protein [Paenibacillus albicereus]
MKKTTMLLSATMAMALLAAGCSGGNGNGNGGGNEGAAGNSDTGKENAAGSGGEASKEPFTIKMALMAGPKTPDSWAEKALEGELEKSMGRKVDVQPIFLPDWSELNTKINLLMSAKDTRPGILWTGDTKEYTKWVDAGIAQDVTPSLQKYGKEILDYYRKDTLFYHWDKSGKIFRIPGDVPEASYMTTIVRKDWLDKLGLQPPKTLDEYIEVIRAFASGDPDGNGKKDTYGISGDNYYRSLAPFFYAYGLDVENFVKNADGSIQFGALDPKVKDVLKLLSELYKEGVMDPRMTTSANNDDNKVNDIYASGKVGSFYRWVDYFNPGNSVNMSFKKLNPSGEYISIAPIQGPDGFSSDLPDPGIGWCYLVVTDATDVDSAVQVLNTMATPEVFKKITFGNEGEHYTMENGIFTPTIQPEEGSKLGFGNFGWYIQRKDAANIKNTPEVTKMFEDKIATSQPMRDKIVVFKAIDRPEWDRYSADVKKVRDELFWGIITGKTPLDSFDKWPAQYEKLGGKKIDEEAAGLFEKQQAEHVEYDKWYEANITPYK